MTENEVKYEEVYKVLNEIVIRNARYMNFKLTQEFKDTLYIGHAKKKMFMMI